ncbi:tryptophan 7-halogenase [Myxococcota bacterium]|nr:tryptophan 7-halogenase [Myxococcota bacterium]
MRASIPSEVVAVVAGGGPAGAAAAIMLASAGLPVLLVERARFPRPHVGESIPPKTTALFDILGVRGDVDAAGFTRMRGTTVLRGGELVTHDFDPDGPGLGYQVERARFDAILFARARRAGAIVLEEHSVVDVVRDGEGPVRGAVIRAADGATTTVRAAFVIDASGARSTLGRRLGVRRREAIHTVALTGYFRGHAVPRDHAPENTIFEMLERGWIWSVLLDDGRRNVTIGVDADALRAEPGRSDDLYHRTVSLSRLVAPLVEGAHLDGELTAHDATWSSSERYALPGALLAGDAASVIDPLTSHGVHKALQSGIVAAAAVRTAISYPERAALALAHHHDEQVRAFERYTDVALTFYQTSPFVDAPFWRVRSRHGLELTRVFAAEDVEATRARRERFLEAVRSRGGRRLVVCARPELEVKALPIAEANLIVLQDALTSRVDPVFRLRREPRHVALRTLASLLDGRTLEDVFEGYVAATGASRSAELGRRLIEVLATLAERDLVELSPVDR